MLDDHHLAEAVSAGDVCHRVEEPFHQPMRGLTGTDVGRSGAMNDGGNLAEPGLGDRLHDRRADFREPPLGEPLGVSQADDQNGGRCQVRVDRGEEGRGSEVRVERPRAARHEMTPPSASSIAASAPDGGRPLKWLTTISDARTRVMSPDIRRMTRGRASPV